MALRKLESITLNWNTSTTWSQRIESGIKFSGMVFYERPWNLSKPLNTVLLHKVHQKNNTLQFVHCEICHSYIFAAKFLRRCWKWMHVMISGKQMAFIFYWWSKMNTWTIYKVNLIIPVCDMNTINIVTMKTDTTGCHLHTSLK